MRTFWQDAASAAIALVLKSALALSASISRFMVVPSAGRYCGGGVFVHRAAKVRSLNEDKAHGGDRLLHCSDLSP
ncbi:hypothetical protein AO262_34875 [Pseudomonas fluorescens ABAC62]|nr:hypothetical protein AO262_34875 [Pseudomonas fluorescens ABAC62]